MRFLDFQLNDFRMSDIIWTVGPGEEMKAERIVILVILGVIDIFTWVKFQQVTRPWNSNIKPDEMTANDIKMGKTPSARYLTSQNATWNVIISVSSNCCIYATLVTIWRIQFWTLYGLLFWSFLSLKASVLTRNFWKY